MTGTIRQIAELAGVSRGTVDRALNNRGRINPEVAKKIHRIAAELDYRPNRRSGSDKEIPQLKIGVITQLGDASFMIQIHEGIENAKKEMHERQVELLIRSSPAVSEAEQLAFIDELEQQGISGLAIMPVECDRVRARLNRLIEIQKIPVVTFNSDIVGTRRSNFVGLDNRKSGATAAGLMGMMTRGSGKILIITGFFTNSVNSLRVEGFIEEVKRAYPKLELLGVQSSSGDAREVEQIIVNTMSRVPDLEGIFVACGGQMGVCEAFKKIKRQQRPYVIVYDLAPENIAAVKDGCFDFLIDQEGYVQGYRAINLLYDLIVRGQTAETMIYTDIRIKTRHNI